MVTSSNGNIFRATGPLCGEFTGHRWIPHTKPVMQSFTVFFDLRLNKRLSKQSWGWWFGTPYRSLWSHCNGVFVNLSARNKLYWNMCQNTKDFQSRKSSNYVEITMRCRHNADIFFQNHHKSHAIPSRSGRAMGCLLWLKTLIRVLTQSRQWCVQYRVILDRVITALHCIMYWSIKIDPRRTKHNQLCPYGLLWKMYSFKAVRFDT